MPELGGGRLDHGMRRVSCLFGMYHMTRSTVHCAPSTGVCGATFVASAVTCAGSMSCLTAQFEGDCNCCDGPGCPTEVPRCVREEICSKVSSSTGSTCEELGNPICAIPPTDAPTTTAPVTAVPSLGAPTATTNMPTESFAAETAS